MDRKSIVSFIVALFLITTIVILYILHFDSRNKYVYVDVQKLMNGYIAMQDARKEFEAKSNAWKANLDTLRQEAETKIKEYEAGANKISAREKKLMEELIQSKQEQFMNYQQVVAEKVKQEDEQLTGKVLTKVNDFIKQHGKNKGYTIVMAATQYGNIIYANDEVDITEEVLKGLNNEYGK